MSATPPAGAMSGSRRTGLASPGRSSSPRRLGSASSKRCRCSGQSATVAENTLIYGWLQVGGQWITYHRYNIGGKVINIGTYFDRRGVIRSGFEDRRLARRSCCSCSPDSCGSAACCPPRHREICSKTRESRLRFDRLTLDQPIDGSNPSSPAAIGFSRDLRSADSAFDHLIRDWVPRQRVDVRATARIRAAERRTSRRNIAGRGGSVHTGLRRVHGIAQMRDTHTGDDCRIPEDDRCVREVVEQPHSCA